MNQYPLIKLRHVSAAYEQKQVLHHIDLTIYNNDFLGIIGPNGGGKTTLVKIILGLLKPTSGDVLFHHNDKKVPEISMGYLPQYNSIDKKFPISVYEVILSGLNKQKSLFHSFSSQQHEQVRNLITRLELDGLERCAIGQLSGGQLQRVLLGRALVSNPQVLILDEPNTYIDKHFEAQLYTLLKDINRQQTIILISHDISAILRNAKNIAYVNHTLEYHPNSNIPNNWLEAYLGYPLNLIEHNQTAYNQPSATSSISNNDKKIKN
jgi:zinc transport system ATP-binding protein